VWFGIHLVPATRRTPSGPSLVDNDGLP
jgi:hypothetical protein